MSPQEFTPPKIIFPQKAYQIRVMGLNNTTFIDTVKKLAALHFPTMQQRQQLSNNQRYISLLFIASIDKSSQLETFHRKVKLIDGFRMCL